MKPSRRFAHKINPKHALDSIHVTVFHSSGVDRPQHERRSSSPRARYQDDVTLFTSASDGAHTRTSSQQGTGLNMNE